MGGLFCRLPAETKWSDIWHMSGVVSPRRQWIFIMIKNMNCIWNGIRETGEFQSRSSCHIEMFFTFDLPHNFNPHSHAVERCTSWNTAGVISHIHPHSSESVTPILPLTGFMNSSNIHSPHTPLEPANPQHKHIPEALHSHTCHLVFHTHTHSHTQQQACCRWRQWWC